MYKITSGILILIMLSLSAYAAIDLSISPTTDGKIANANEVISKAIRLSNANSNNNLSVPLPNNIRLFGAKINISANVTYNVSSPINVLASNLADINYTFTVPSDAFNESYIGVFNFTSGGNFSEYKFNLNVTGNPNLIVNNLTANIGINHSRALKLFLENKGNTDITASLVKSELISTANPANKIAGNNIILGDATLSIPYKKTGTTSLKVNIPSGQPKELYVGNVTINFDSKQIISKITVNVSEPIYNLELPSTIAFPNAEPNTTQSLLFTIKNTGSADITSLNFSSNADKKYNLSFNTTQAFDLGIGEIKPIKITLIIPKDEITSNHSIASISLTNNEKNFTNFATVYVDIQSKLEIDSLDFFIDNDINNKDVSETNLMNGETVSERARPGSKIRLDFKIKNKFSEDSKIDINNIVIKATIKSIEEDEDAELEAQEFDLEAGKTSIRKVLAYNIPLKVDDDTYQIDIEVEGEDEDGVEHSTARKIFFKVDKKSHDIIIEKVKITPETVTCDIKGTVNVVVVNAGKHTEEDVKVEALNDALGIKFVEEKILLESGEDEDIIYEESIPFNISTSVAQGTYPIIVKAYYSGDIIDDLKQANLEVKFCTMPKEQIKETKAEERTMPEDVSEEAEEVITKTEPTEEEAIIAEEKPLLKNPAVLGIITLVNILLVGGAIGLAAKFLIKR